MATVLVTWRRPCVHRDGKAPRYILMFPGVCWMFQDSKRSLFLEPWLRVSDVCMSKVNRMVRRFAVFKNCSALTVSVTFVVLVLEYSFAKIFFSRRCRWLGTLRRKSCIPCPVLFLLAVGLWDLTLTVPVWTLARGPDLGDGQHVQQNVLCSHSFWRWAMMIHFSFLLAVSDEQIVIAQETSVDTTDTLWLTGWFRSKWT